MAILKKSRRKPLTSPEDIVAQEYQCTKCLKCLKPASNIGCGYVLLGDIKVVAAWCDKHGGTGPGLLNQKDKPLGVAVASSIDNSTSCWGGWHEKYGLTSYKVSRGY